MPVFQYEAVDKRGRTLKGTMPAQDEASLEQKLTGLGLWLTESTLARTLPSGVVTVNRFEVFLLRFRQKQLRRELIDFCTVMAYQIKVGITLVRALEVARQDCKNPVFGQVLADLQSQLESGARLHEAMARHPAFFSPHFLSVVRAGEMTSKMPEGFQDLKDYVEWLDGLISDVRQATLYPCIVLVVITGFVLFLFSFIIPKFADLLDNLHVKQPLLTQAVFSVGEVTRSYWWVWLPVLLLALLGIPIGRRFWPAFAYAVDRMKLRLPVFGPLNEMLALSRFAHNLAILYRSGLPILQAFELCKHGMIGNAVIERAVAEVEEDVKTGSTISEAMHRQPVFTSMLTRMVSTGEMTGNLDAALENVAEYYNEVIPRRIKAIFAVLEPAMMLFLIFLVGTVALAIYLPIISLMGSIH